MIFKYSELREFLKFTASQADVIPFREWKGQKAILMRHDIDLDIFPAYELARIERELGIGSTFMVMTTCPAYNPLSDKNRRLLRQMIEWGFEIGLHLDPNIYGCDSIKELEKHLKEETKILETACGQEIRSISLHNPSGFGDFPIFDGFINAYDPRIFRDECYMSDSRMLFSGKNPYEFVRRVKEMPLQIALHPNHYTVDGNGYPEIFHGIAARYINDLDRWFRVNSTYVEQMPQHLYDYFIKAGKKKNGLSAGVSDKKMESVPTG